MPAPSLNVLFVGFFCLWYVDVPETPRLQIDRHQNYVSDTLRLPPQCNPICFFLYTSTAISFINSRAISFIFLKRPLSSVAAVRFFQDRVLEEEQVTSAALALPCTRRRRARCSVAVTITSHACQSRCCSCSGRSTACARSITRLHFLCFCRLF